MSEPDSSGPLGLKYPYTAPFLAAILLLAFALLFDLTPLGRYLPEPALVRGAAGLGTVVLLLLTLRLHAPPKGPKAGRDKAGPPALTPAPPAQTGEPLEKRLLSDLVHELRSPLTAIQGFTELLATRPLSETTRQEWLQTLHQEAQQMSALLEQTLDIVRLREGRLQLHLRTVKPQDWLAEVFARYRNTVPSITLQLDSAADAPPIQIDAGRLEQAVQTLLESATSSMPSDTTVILRYLPHCPAPHTGHQTPEDRCPGGPTLLITAAGLKTEAVDTDLVVAAGQHPYRPENAQSALAGLRFTIVREIVALHGGIVWAQGHDLEGTGGGGYLGITFPPELSGRAQSTG